MTPEVSIMGCGWLGLPVAKHLIGLGFDVKGSTTSVDKVPTLRSFGIQPFMIESVPPLKGECIKEFFQSKILVINVPFRRTLPSADIYKNQIESIIQAMLGSPVEFVIFASSTAVYPKNLSEAKEDASFLPDTPRAQILLEIEQMLLKQKNFSATIIRLAGLYGGERLIGNFLSMGKRPKADLGPANLIHQDDCVAIIAKIIQHNIRGEVLNACSDVHPMKDVLYSRAAKNLHLPPPAFEKNAGRVSKIVPNDKLKMVLQYRFKHPNPLDDC